MRPASENSRSRSARTLEEKPPRGAWRPRNVGTGSSRSSHITRSAQRRPSISRSAMTGRPVDDPLTGLPGRGVGLEGDGGTGLAGSVRGGRCFRFQSTNASMAIVPRNSKQHRVVPLEPPYDAGAAAALELLGPPIALSRQSALTLRQRELVIDRTTALCGADYEWGVHIAFFAERAALTTDQVRSLGTGQPDDACWADPADRAVLRAVDELHTSHDLEDGTWDGLVDAAGTDGALDLLLLCGWYHAISFTVRSLHLPLELGTAPIR